MQTKVRVRWADGEEADMMVDGPVAVGDRVRGYGDDAVAVVVECIPEGAMSISTEDGTLRLEPFWFDDDRDAD